MRLLALTAAPEFVCYRYRLNGFAPMLAERGWSLEPMAIPRSLAGFLEELPRIAAADAVVLQRTLFSWCKRRLLRRAAKVLIYDFDDAVFLRDSNQRRSAQSIQRWRRFRDTVRLADVCLAGNDYLRTQAVACAGPERVFAVPTCVDPHRYPVAGHCREGSDVELVWIGSRATLPSLELIKPGLHAANGCLPGLKLKIICDAFPEMRGMCVLPVRWSEETEAEEIAAADIGIAWLPEHPWSLGKCGLKVLQYMAAGLPVVANPIGVHRQLITHGETGFLAATPMAWREALLRLANSAELRRSMGARARERVLRRYSPDCWGPQFAAMVDEAAGGRPARTRCEPEDWRREGRPTRRVAAEIRHG